MIKQKIDNYIIPITLMFVMGMMLFRVNDPLCLKTIFLLMLTFAVKPFGTYRWTLIDWSILIIWGYDIISCCAFAYHLFDITLIFTIQKLRKNPFKRYFQTLKEKYIFP